MKKLSKKQAKQIKGGKAGNAGKVSNSKRSISVGKGTILTIEPDVN